jgi:hypothetical protein
VGRLTLQSLDSGQGGSGPGLWQAQPRRGSHSELLRAAPQGRSDQDHSSVSLALVREWWQVSQVKCLRSSAVIVLSVVVVVISVIAVLFVVLVGSTLDC